MKLNRALAALIIAASASLAHGQEPSKLAFKGKTEVVKVERIVRFMDDRLSLTEFPFSLEAPAGAIRPSWTVPSGVTWTRKGRLLEVTAAPKGELKISADWAVLDKKTLDITEEFETFSILIGGVAPPDPPPSPSTPLTKSLQAAYDNEKDAAKLLKLAEVMEEVVALSRESGKIKTSKDMQTTVKTATDITIGQASLPRTRAAIGLYLLTTLGTNPSAPADAAFWARASSEYAYVALSLKGVSR